MPATLDTATSAYSTSAPRPKRWFQNEEPSAEVSTARPIRSGADIGWLRDLKVGQMMRRDATPVLCDTNIEQFRRRYPPGSRYRIVITEYDGTYLGVLSVPEMHNPASDGKEMTDLLRLSDTFLTTEMSAPEALKLFTKTGTDALAVVDKDTHKALGVLMEPYVLRRCAELAERRMRELVDGSRQPAVGARFSS